MSKITLNSIASLDTIGAATTINTNMTTIQTAFDNTLSRDGTSPNTMGASFDMNSNRILNLPAPASSTDPVRVQDLQTYSLTNLITVVASLPAASSNKGARAVVTDATATTFASVVSGSGGTTIPVYSDGTNWRIG